MKIRTAQRKKAKMKMALQGPSGSGKTYSALLLAYGLCKDWNKITVIDTENNSSDLYSHLGDYNVLSFSAPFTPERYIEAIEACEKAGSEVIIIDSITHEWETLLQFHSNLPGNSFTNWAKVTPRHQAFVQKILQSPAHVIATIRTKQDYVLSEKNGKQIPEKVGLKAITRDGMDYEFTVVLDIDRKHNAVSSKDRTGLFTDQPPFVISEQTGEKIMAWCEQGTSKQDVIHLIGKASDVDSLRNIYSDYPEYRSEIHELLLKRKEALEGNLQTAV
jgi:hypothetical protein